MKKIEILFGILRVPLDALSVLVALLLAYHLRLANIDLIPGVQLLADRTAILPPLDIYQTTFVWPSVGIFVAIAALLGLYSLKVDTGGWRHIGRLCETAGLWLVLIMGWFFLVKEELFFSRILLLHSTLFIALFAGLLRALLLMVQRWMLTFGIGVRTVASFGAIKIHEPVENLLEQDPHYRYLGHVKTYDALMTIAEKNSLDLVLHTDPNPSDSHTLELIEYCRSEHIEYAFFPPVLTDSPHLLSVDRMGLLPLLRFKPTPLDGWGRVWKRCFDVAGSIVLMILLSPLLLFIALCIVIDSGFPIFYVSKRVGLGGKKKISVVKFRTMIRDADARKEELVHLNHRTDGPLFKVKDDPRVTRVGKLLRRFSFDEFPQLWSVLRGHMALVGPRPHLPEEVKRYSSYQRRVFAICPGMTGLAQISGRSDLSFEEEVRLDLQYIEEWSLGRDLWILWRTIFVIVDRKGAD